MKLAIDTNVWVRYLVRDNENSFVACKRLFEAVEEGKVRPYVSSIVLLELWYVLMSLYKIPKSEVQHDIEAILASRGLVILEKTDFRKAFALHREKGVKLADCLIATQIGVEIPLCTYDEEFKKIRSLRTITPEQAIK